MFFFLKLKKTLNLLAYLHFLTIFTQYEHTTYDYVLDIFIFCVRDSYVCVREKIYFIEL